MLVFELMVNCVNGGVYICKIEGGEDIEGYNW